VDIAGIKGLNAGKTETAEVLRKFLLFIYGMPAYLSLKAAWLNCTLFRYRYMLPNGYPLDGKIRTNTG
jgi:hypothetical protein